MLLILLGLALPWVDISFEISPAIVQGWEFFYWAIILEGFGFINYTEYGIELSILNFFTGLSGIFLLYYLIQNVIAMVKPQKRNLLILILLASSSTIIIFNALFGWIAEIFLGFYLFIIGICSSIILEWQSGRFEKAA
jgi:hypothetical protein